MHAFIKMPHICLVLACVGVHFSDFSSPRTLDGVLPKKFEDCQDHIDVVESLEFESGTNGDTSHNSSSFLSLLQESHRAYCRVSSASTFGISFVLAQIALDPLSKSISVKMRAIFLVSGTINLSVLLPPVCQAQGQLW